MPMIGLFQVVGPATFHHILAQSIDFSGLCSQIGWAYTIGDLTLPLRRAAFSWVRSKLSLMSGAHAYPLTNVYSWR